MNDKLNDDLVQEFKRKKNAAKSSTQRFESETEDKEEDGSQIYEPQNIITSKQKSLMNDKLNKKFDQNGSGKTGGQPKYGTLTYSKKQNNISDTSRSMTILNSSCNYLRIFCVLFVFFLV